MGTLGKQIPPPTKRRIPSRLPHFKLPSFIPTEGLVRCYLPYVGEGDTLEDYSESNSDGSIGAGVSWTYEPWRGWFLAFGGTTDYVDVPAFSNFDEYTVMVLTKHHSVNDGDYDCDFEIRYNNGIHIRDDGAGNLNLNHLDTGGNWHYKETSMSNDVWILATQRYDGSTVTGWKNDSQFWSESVDGVGDNDNNTTLGYSRSAAGEALDGDQALVLVYDVAKPDSFIVNLANLLGVA